MVILQITDIKLKTHKRRPYLTLRVSYGVSFVNILGITGFDTSGNFHLSDFQILHFLIKIIYDLEENFSQIYLPDLQFYLPQAIRQWDASGSGILKSWITVYVLIQAITQASNMLENDLCFLLQPCLKFIM